MGLDFSPIKGPEGNIEFLMYVKKAIQVQGLFAEIIDAVVQQAHQSL